MSYKINIYNLYITIKVNFLGLELDTYFEIIHRIDWHIKRQATGTPKEFSSKLSMSARHLTRYISLMRRIGCPIEYNRKIQSYLYTRNGELLLKWKND